MFLSPYRYCARLTPNLCSPLPVVLVHPTLFLPFLPGKSHPTFSPPCSTGLSPRVGLHSGNINTGLRSLFPLPSKRPTIAYAFSSTANGLPSVQSAPLKKLSVTLYSCGSSRFSSSPSYPSYPTSSLVPMGSGSSKPIRNTNRNNRRSLGTTYLQSTTATRRQSVVPPRLKNGEREAFTAAIDQGTTSSRFLIFDRSGTPRASHQVEFGQLYPHSGWIEHDPYEILNSVNECIEKATKIFFDKGYAVDDIKALGITNQRETTVVWDTETGKPLYNAIVWPDTRTAKLVHELRRKAGSEKLRQLCGLPLSTYPSSVKLMWMLRHVPAVQSALRNDRLSFGTVDSWLLYNLTGGVKNGLHVTDSTNASRTMFCNINTLEYDDFLIDWFGVRGVKLPKIVPSSDPDAYGNISDGVLAGTKIAGCLGDQSAALVGQCAFTPGMAKNTYGTGCFLLYNTGYEPVVSENGLLTTVAYAFKGFKPVYALEGSIAVAGSAIKFLRDNLGLIKESSEIGELAAKVPDTGGVVFVTAFSGLFAPYWIDDAQGTIFGITQYTTKEHIARATIEATCYQAKAILNAMEKDSGTALHALAVDGGMSNSDVCMQLQADIMGIDVDRPQMRETTALGAAIAAGFAVGMWKEFDELKGINRDNRKTFSPMTEEATREKWFSLWGKAVERSRGWVDNGAAEVGLE